jgi:hypothetical protein
LSEWQGGACADGAGFPEDVRMLSQDIRFARSPPPAFVGEDHPIRTRSSWRWWPAALASKGRYVYARRRQVVMLDQAGYRYRKAIKVAQKWIREA